MLFKENAKLTTISVSEFGGMTIKREIRITQIVNDRPAYVVKGKRKEYYFDLKPDMLVFEGWGLPLKVDTETNDFSGNGCINFVVTGNVHDLRLFIIHKNVNKRFNAYEEIYVKPSSDINGTVCLFNEQEIKQLSNENSR